MLRLIMELTITTFFCGVFLIIGLFVGRMYGAAEEYKKIKEQFFPQSDPNRTYRAAIAAEPIKANTLVTEDQLSAISQPFNLQDIEKFNPVNREANQKGSSVMYYKSPKELQDERDKQAMDEELRDLAQGRQSGTYAA